MKTIVPLHTCSFLLAVLLVESAPAQTWRQVLTTTAPAARQGHGMVYDAARGNVLLFGGELGGSPWQVNDTWTWNGTTWVQLTPGLSPWQRVWHGMAYDPVRQRVVMFGGNRGGSVQNAETWEWDGTNWLFQTPTTRPPARQGCAMAYDPVQGGILLFGGEAFVGGSWVSLGDTWFWNGQDWRLVATTTAPLARSGATMVLDESCQRIVFFGGWSMTLGVLSDMWLWNGSAWTQATPAVVPSPRGGALGAYDAVRHRIVLFGGVDGRLNPLNETWEWDCTRGTWQQMQPVASPVPRDVGGLAYDRGSSRMVLFGGRDLHVSPRFGDTWLYPGGSYEGYGYGCGTPMRAGLTTQGAPEVQRTVTVRSWYTGAVASFLAVGMEKWNIDLTSQGMPGCWLYQSTDFWLPMPNHVLAFSIPNQTSLIGTQLFLQGIVTDPSANPTGAVTTHGCRLFIGARTF